MGQRRVTPLRKGEPSFVMEGPDEVEECAHIAVEDARNVAPIAFSLRSRRTGGTSNTEA